MGSDRSGIWLYAATTLMLLLHWQQDPWRPAGDRYIELAAQAATSTQNGNCWRFTTSSAWRRDSVCLHFYVHQAGDSPLAGASTPPTQACSLAQRCYLGVIIMVMIRLLDDNAQNDVRSDAVLCRDWTWHPAIRDSPRVWLTESGRREGGRERQRQRQRDRERERERERERDRQTDRQTDREKGRGQGKGRGRGHWCKVVDGAHVMRPAFIASASKPWFHVRFQWVHITLLEVMVSMKGSVPRAVQITMLMKTVSSTDDWPFLPSDKLLVVVNWINLHCWAAKAPSVTRVL